MARCLHLLLASGLATASAKYFDHDSRHPNRHSMQNCGAEFECPAFHRPIQREEEAYKVWTWDRCLNLGRGVMDSKYFNTLKPCCQSKYVCMQTCGMKVQDCFDHYWQCAEMECARHDGQSYNECLAAGSINDLRHFSEKPVEHFQGFGDESCKAWVTMQSRSCECVPTEKWEGRLQERFESFFKAHEPEMLNAKGKIKDKKLWKAWKGKRSQMFLSLMLKHRKKVLDIRSTPTPKVHSHSAEM